MLKPRKEFRFHKVLLGGVLLAALLAGGIWVLAPIRRLAFPAGVASGPDSVGASVEETLARARDAITQGKPEEARPLLEPIVAHVKDNTFTPQALMLLARVDKKAGKTEEAAKLLDRAYRDFASSPEHPRAAVAYAQALEESGGVDEALRIYQEVRDSAPRELRAGATTGCGRDAERKKDLLKARDLYRESFAEAPWDSEDWNEALDALGRVNVELIFSPQETPESKRYSVQRRDSITSIGNALNTTQGLLMRANALSETTTLNLGQQLKYTPKDFRIVIERSRCRLFLIDKDGIFKRYSVGLGKPGHETTLGSYKIGNKEKNPIWHKPGAGAIPALDPTNELGTRWMPLVPDQEGLPKDLGIHGTIRPETVGLNTSNGCARLLPVEVEELYDMVVRSTPVDILETYTGEIPEKPQEPSTAQASSSTS